MTPLTTNKTVVTIGLEDEDLQNITTVLNTYTEVEEAVIFGSRAKGNYKNASDVDIALKGTSLNYTITGNISYLLNEETQMLYQFDVLNYYTINNKDLTEHINRIGISFYKRSGADV